jgi:hypothetical protein
MCNSNRLLVHRIGECGGAKHLGQCRRRRRPAVLLRSGGSLQISSARELQFSELVVEEAPSLERLIQRYKCQCHSPYGSTCVSVLSMPQLGTSGFLADWHNICLTLVRASGLDEIYANALVECLFCQQEWMDFDSGFLSVHEDCPFYK